MADMNHITLACPTYQNAISEPYHTLVRYRTSLPNSLRHFAWSLQMQVHMYVSLVSPVVKMQSKIIYFVDAMYICEFSFVVLLLITFVFGSVLRIS